MFLSLFPSLPLSLKSISMFLGENKNKKKLIKQPDKKLEKEKQSIQKKATGWN